MCVRSRAGVHTRRCSKGLLKEVEFVRSSQQFTGGSKRRTPNFLMQKEGLHVGPAAKARLEALGSQADGKPIDKERHEALRLEVETLRSQRETETRKLGGQEGQLKKLQSDQKTLSAYEQEHKVLKDREANLKVLSRLFKGKGFLPIKHRVSNISQKSFDVVHHLPLNCNSNLGPGKTIIMGILLLCISALPTSPRLRFELKRIF